MPIKVQSDLPAGQILETENIFVMDENRALHQDIRPLSVLILNNMPVKQDTELQLLRALSNVYSGFDFLVALKLPSTMYNMLPYIISLLVLAIFSQDSRAPKAEGIPYDKGQR